MTTCKIDKLLLESSNESKSKSEHKIEYEFFIEESNEEEIIVYKTYIDCTRKQGKKNCISFDHFNNSPILTFYNKREGDKDIDFFLVISSKELKTVGDGDYKNNILEIKEDIIKNIDFSRVYLTLIARGKVKRKRYFKICFLVNIKNESNFSHIKKTKRDFKTYEPTVPPGSSYRIVP